MMKKLSLLAAVTILCAAPLSLQWSSTKMPSLAFDQAQARVGRPATPMSVAGVNRRVNRRGYYGAAAGAAAVGAAAYGNYYYNQQPQCGYAPYPPCY